MAVTGPARIALIINELSAVGGAEVQLRHLATGLAERGHAVTVCAIDSLTVDTSALAALDIELIEIGAKSPRHRARALPRLVKLARRVDVVHCTMWDPSLWGRLAAIVARRPVIVADHSTDRAVQVSKSGHPRGDLIALHNRLLDPFTFATVACASSQRALLESEGVAAKKIVYIPNGVPTARVRLESRGTTRGDLGLPDDAFVIVQVGVFRPEKNQIGGVEIFAELKRDHPGAHLLLAGDGEMRPAVEERVGELGVEDVHFLGARRDVPALIALSDLLILPSSADAMPMVVIEAMALGTPIVGSDVGDVKDMLGSDGGICLPAADKDAFVTAIGALIDDPAERERLGAAARIRSDAFDSSAMVSEYETLFKNACRRSRPQARPLTGP